MNVLIIGSGGREHALAFKASQSTLCQKVFVAPGNAGTHREPKVENIAIDVMDFDRLVDFAKKHSVSLTIVGPEAPLVDGIVDYFEQHHLPILGPTQFAAQLEGSKTFAKTFMQEHHIPTAQAKYFTSVTDALAYCEHQSYPLVIKADGLAAGKGVVVAQNIGEASVAIESMLGGQFGNASTSILIEDFVTGEEASFIALCDGEHALAFASAQDHKQRDDGDKGPNTGGMGAYSPAPIITPCRHQQIMQHIIEPTLKGMRDKGYPFKGFLYAGLMINEDSINVLEFNVRFGDPEAQAILMRLQSDLVDVSLHVLQGDLDQIKLQWDPRASLGVVLAANGYPNQYQKGDNLSHLRDILTSTNNKIFHAGTKLHDNNIVSCGGRVLCATALGEDFATAQKQAYALAKKARWENAFYRHDIGNKALENSYA